MKNPIKTKITNAIRNKIPTPDEVGEFLFDGYWRALKQDKTYAEQLRDYDKALDNEIIRKKNKQFAKVGEHGLIDIPDEYLTDVEKKIKYDYLE